MNAKVGVIEYDVDADTSGLLLAEKQVDSSTKNMQKDFIQTDRSVKQLNVQMKKLPVSVKAANQSMGMFGRRAGMASIQVQQLIGQVKGGQDPMVAFSQQSADLGFVLGFPLLGAVISIAAALGGPLLSAIFNTENSVEALEKAMESLSETIDYSDEGVLLLTKDLTKLVKVSREAAQVQIAQGMIDAKDAIKSANLAIIDTLDSTERLFDSFDFDLASSLFFANGKQTVDEFTKAISRTSRVGGKSMNQLARNVDQFSETLSITKDEASELFGTALINEMHRTAESSKKLEEVTAGLAVKYADSNTEGSKLLVTLSGQASAANIATKKLSELKVALKDIDKAVAESEEGRKKKGKADEIGPGMKEFYAQRGRNASDKKKLEQAFESETEVIARKFTERQELITNITAKGEEDRLELSRKNGELYLSEMANIAAREEALQSKQMMANIGAFASAASNLAAIAQEGGKKSFLKYKRFAQASAALSASMAVIQTLADPNITNTYAKFALAGTIGGLAGAQIASIEKQTYSGRALGGPVGAGKPYRVGESGPEMFRDGNRSYLIPGESGQVTPMGAANGGGSGVNFTIINSGSAKDVAGQRIDENGVTVVMLKDAMGQVKSDINTSLSTGQGDTSTALQKGFDVSRKLR